MYPVTHLVLLQMCACVCQNINYGHLQVGNLVRPCFATSYEKNALLSAESSDDYSVTFLSSAEGFCCLIAISLVLSYVL